MKKRLFGILCIFVVFVITLGMCTPYISYADETSPDKGIFEYIPVSACYDSMGRKIETEFFYNDLMLFKNSNSLDPEIAKMSVVLAAAAYNYKYIADLFLDYDAMAFDNITFYNYEIPDNQKINDNRITYVGSDRTEYLGDYDYVGFSIASKEIVYNGEPYIIYFVPIRGTHGEEDWYSNFNLGEAVVNKGRHTGFYKAANDVLDHAAIKMRGDQYDSSHTKILFTGHSRGAAVANISAGKFTCEENYGDCVDKENVFGYTFACPSVSYFADTDINNIYNFNNPGDLIPILPLEKWGYKRYGRTISELSDAQWSNISSRFSNITGDRFASARDTEAYNDLINRFLKKESDYGDPDAQILFTVIATFLGDNSAEGWGECFVKIGLDDEYILKKLNERFGPSVAGSLASTIEKINAFLELAQEQTEGMSEEEFQEWLNQDEIQKMQKMISEDSGNTISSIHSLLLTSKKYAKAYRKVKVLYTLESLAEFLYKLSDNPKMTITDGHRCETYVTMINTLYLGYEGWLGNDSLKTIPVSNAETIGSRCFANCSALSLALDISDKKKYIGDFAFWKSGIWYLTIDTSDVKIGRLAFGEIESLRAVRLPVDLDTGGSAFGNMGEYNGTCHNYIEIIHYTPGKTGIMADRSAESKDENYFCNYLEYNATNLREVVFEEGITEIGDYFFATYQLGKYPSVSYSVEPYPNKLSKVKLPESLVKIGDYAFYCETALENIDLPDSVESLGKRAFSCCTSLDGIFNECPEGLKTIGDECFYSSGLSGKLCIYPSIEYVGPLAFSYTQIDELEIMSSDVTIKSFAFLHMPELKTVTLPADLRYEQNAFGKTNNWTNEQLNHIEVVNYTRGKSGIVLDKNGDFSYSGGLEFTSDSLNTVSFENGITRIGSLALAYTSVSTVNLPDTVIEIGEMAFGSTANLEYISFPKTLKRIEGNAFYSSGLKGKIILEPNIEFVGSNAFAITKIEELEIKSSDTFISTGAFCSNTCLKSVTLPIDLEYQPNAFGKIKSYNIVPTYIETIHYTYGKTGKMPDRDGSNSNADNYYTKMLEYTSPLLKKITFEDGITEIGDYAFASSTIGKPKDNSTFFPNALTEVQLPESLKRIGDRAFYSVTSLEEIVLPDSLEILGSYAFACCYGLTNVLNTLPANLEYIGDNAFYYSGVNGKLVIEDHIKHIGNYAFGYTALSELEIKSSDVEIGTGSFWSITNLRTVTIPVDLSYSQYAFGNISSNNYNYPNYVETIHYTYGKTGQMPGRSITDSKSAWYLYGLLEYNSVALRTITFEEEITDIGDYTFFTYYGGKNCGVKNTPAYENTLIDVVIPNSIKRIGVRAFAGQNKLEQICIPGTIEELGIYCFEAVPENAISFFVDKGSEAENRINNMGYKVFYYNYPYMDYSDVMHSGSSMLYSVIIYSALNATTDNYSVRVKDATHRNTYIQDGVLYIALTEQSENISLVVSYNGEDYEFPVYVDTIKDSGWVFWYDKWYYIDSNTGDQVLGKKNIDGINYVFDSATGELLKGEWKAGERTKRYYFAGVPVVGWNVIDGNTYYFDEAGERVDGWTSVDNTWYYFNADKGMRVKDAYIDGILYKFNEDGSHTEGTWKKVGSAMKYYFAGSMMTGWCDISGERYYFAESGNMVTGVREIDGVIYEFAEDGHLITDQYTGFYARGSKTFYYEDGIRIDGWAYVDDNWYYFNGDKGMRVTDSYINGILYKFNPDGTHTEGTWKSSSKGSKYYFAGAMALGWREINGNTYFFKENGYRATGICEADGIACVFDENGVLVQFGYEGFFKKGSKCYYYEAGVRAVGWRFINENYYYFGEDGNMAVTATYIDGVSYKFNSDGTHTEGTWKAKNRRYYFAGQMTIGWKEIEGNTYYFDQEGYKVTGIQEIDGHTYRFSDDGILIEEIVNGNNSIEDTDSGIEDEEIRSSNALDEGIGAGDIL